MFIRGPWGHSVHPESLGSLGLALRVVGFIRGRWIYSGSRWGSLDSSVVDGFTRVCAGVVGFIRVHFVSRWGSLGKSGVVLFTRVRFGSH